MAGVWPYTTPDNRNSLIESSVEWPTIFEFLTPYVGPQQAAGYAARILKMAHNFLIFSDGFGDLLDKINGPTEELPDLYIPSITSGDQHISEGAALALVDEIFRTRPAPPVIEVFSPGELSPPPELNDPRGYLPEIVAPDFTAVPPVTDFSGAPVITSFDFPAEPTVNSVGVPDAPNYPVPVTTELVSISVPSMLTLDIPDFVEELEEFDIPAPEASLNFDEQMYVSRLSSAVKALLSSELVSGGYGIDPSDEEREFFTARDKTTREYESEVLQASLKFGTTGFIGPIGPLNAAITAGLSRALDNLEDEESRLVSKRFTLYTERKKFIQEQSIRFEKMFSEYHSAMMGRALEAAIAVGDLVTARVNAIIAAYNLKADRFRELAKVYRARVDAEVARVDAYRASVQAAGLLNEANEAVVAQYSAEVKYVGALALAYKAEVDKNATLLEIERLRTQIYQAQVDAYAAQVQVNKIIYDVYVAQIDGEMGKVETYKAEAQAYASTVAGKKALIENKSLELEQAIAVHNDQIKLFETTAGYLRSARKSYMTSYESISTSLSEEASAYREDSAAISEIYNGEQSFLAGKYDNKLTQLKAMTQEAGNKMSRLASIAKTSVAIASARTNVYAALSASGMASANLNTTIGSSNSDSLSNSASESTSYGFSRSTSDNVGTSVSKNYLDSTTNAEHRGYAMSISAAFRQINDYGLNNNMSVEHVQTTQVEGGMEMPNAGTVEAPAMPDRPLGP